MSASPDIFRPHRACRGVPAHLAGTNRVLERWAASIGDGLSEISWDEVVRCKVPPLDFDMAIVVDKLVVHSPPRTRKIVSIWYRKPVPVEVIAREMGIDKAVVHYYWECALGYFQRRFEYSPFPWLRSMALVDVVGLEK